MITFILHNRLQLIEVSGLLAMIVNKTYLAPGSRTTPHEDNSPPDKPNHCPPGPQSLELSSTRTTPH